MNSSLSLSKAILQVCFPLAIEFFLYGIFAILFIMAVILFHRRGQRCARWLNLVATSTLFLLATSAVIVDVVFEGITLQQIAGYPVDRTTEFHLVVVEAVLFVAANLITDTLLIFRCYMIWGRRKSIVAPSILLTLGNNLSPVVLILSQKGFYNLLKPGNMERVSISTATFLAINTFANLLLTSLIAGRIWWIVRQARGILCPEARKKYKTIVAITLESGILYPLALIPYAVLILLYSDIFLFPMLVQVVGIIPTLIMVRVGLGVSIENNTSPMATTGSRRPQNDISYLSLTVPQFSQATELSVVESGRAETTESSTEAASESSKHGSL